MLQMDQGDQSFDVLYERQDGNVSFLSGIRNATYSSWVLWKNKTQSRTCELSVHRKRLLLACFILVGTSLALYFLLNNKPSSCQETAKALPVLPDVVNLSLVATTQNSFTVTWERPEGNFDYYLIDVPDDHDTDIGSSRKRIAGSCANGAIIRRDMTHVTCLQLETCSNVSFRVSTHITGPPERTSHGVTLNGIFIPAEDPVPPGDITVVSSTPSETLIRWPPPENVFGAAAEYIVMICDKFDVCDGAENVRTCTEYNPSEALLKFKSAADTTYCVLVFAIVQCGTDVAKSLPAAKQIRTPIFALPEVRNLYVVSVADREVTLKWDKPQIEFDYYCIDTAAGREQQDQNATIRTVGSCENSTIIHPNQNQVTRRNFQACVNVTLTVRIYRKGPPELLSLPTTAHDVFIPGQDLGSPRNIIVKTQADGWAVLQWEPPAKVDGVLGKYIVKICNSYKACVPTDEMGNCTEYRTSSSMLEVKDTSAAYCVLVTATSKCGDDVLESRPFAKEVIMSSAEHPPKSLFKWVAWSGSNVPDNAVLGGEDESHPTYICRARHKEDIIPGKLVPRYHKCYVSYDGFEHEYNKSEVLVFERTLEGSNCQLLA